MIFKKKDNLKALALEASRLSGQDYKIKTLSNDGVQLVDHTGVFIFGGPYGCSRRDLTNLINAYIKGLRK